jgi:hypothetical protein
MHSTVSGASNLLSTAVKRLQPTPKSASSKLIDCPSNAPLWCGDVGAPCPPSLAPRSLPNALPSLHPRHPIRHTRERNQPFHPNRLQTTDMLHTNRVRWLDHLTRMSPDRLPHKVLFSCLGGNLAISPPGANTSSTTRIHQSDSWLANTANRQEWKRIIHTSRKVYAPPIYSIATNMD